MRPSAIVMYGELLDGPSKMTFVERNQVVQALAPEGSDQPLAERIRHGRPDGRPDRAYAEPSQRFIQRRREDRVAVVNHEPVRMVEWQDFAKLLGRPLGRGMRGHIGM